jgi:polyhydroxybutyrate depolymerase
MKNSLLLITILASVAVFAQSGTVVHDSIAHEGLSRAYKIYVPNAYDGTTSVPLIFNLHGLTSNMDEQLFYGDFRSIADTANFLVVHPNGTINASGQRFWNSFGLTGVDDVDFLSTLIDSLNAVYNIDLDRVYSTGMSNGGYMSFELACQLNNRITAIASVTGGMLPTRLAACNPSHPTPVMQIHGTNDGTVPYNGGVITAPIEDIVDYWVNENNCNQNPTLFNVPDNDPNDGCTAEQFVYSGGDRNATVEHYKITGGGHTWPGAFVNTGVTNQDFDASVEIWRFFSQYSLEQLANVNEQEQLDTDITVYPNPTNGLVTVQLDPIHTALELTVLDALGRKVKAMQITQQEQTIQLDKPGVYFFILNSGGKQETQRIIVR